MNCSHGGMLTFILILLTTGNVSLAQSKNDLSSSTTVLLTVTVTNNRKELVPGLLQSAFTVSDDRGIRKIISFSNEDVPSSLAILFDTSGSIKSLDDRNKAKFMIEALWHFVQRNDQSNEYFIVGFNDRPHLLLDGTRDTSAVSSLLQKLTSVQSRGNTALFDACIFAINKVVQGVYPKQVILLISDGKDNVSQSTLNDVRRLLKEKNVSVYALNTTMGLGEIGFDPLNTEGSQVLDELTSITGGVNYRPSNLTEMKANLERIALELRHQYSIGISSAKGAAGSKWHSLKVKVSSSSANARDAQKLSGRSRKGYYSAASKE